MTRVNMIASLGRPWKIVARKRKTKKECMGGCVGIVMERDRNVHGRVFGGKD